MRVYGWGNSRQLSAISFQPSWNRDLKGTTRPGQLSVRYFSATKPRMKGSQGDILKESDETKDLSDRASSIRY
jgi:hypothetical protein